jgi:hypothetical protein
MPGHTPQKYACFSMQAGQGRGSTHIACPLSQEVMDAQHVLKA